MFSVQPTPVGPGIMEAIGVFSFPASTAAATAAVNAGGVSNLTLVSGGSGYSTAPAVTLTGGGGSGANVTASVANGSVTGFTVNAAGTGYTSAPTVSIAAPDGKYNKMTIPCPFRTIFGVWMTPLTGAGNDDNLRANATPVSNAIPNPSVGNISIERSGSNLTANLSLCVLIKGQ